MPHYLVLKRIVHDWVSLPGEILTDLRPREAGILMSRGFIMPVPSDYPGPISVPPSKDDGEGSSTSEDPPADGEQDLKALMSNNRNKLNVLASEAGIENPEAFATKREVAEAILAKISDGGAGS